MSEKMDGLSMDIEHAEREKLRAVFPQCFTEGRLDIDKLLNLCGEYITDDFEKYEFRWKGKSECLQLAGKRSAGTLRPCPEESVDWESTRNLYIEGDNLEVLKLLQTSYYRKVKMIYIDPPYNTGNDFVYADDFADPLARYREVTQQTTKSNPETMGRFHTNWLNMMYPRLRLAANLLRDDGVIFISIDDNELDNLKKLCNEVFGEENFVAQISYINNPKGRSHDMYFAACHEYILIYTKSALSKGSFSISKDEDELQANYTLSDDNGAYRLLELRNTHREFGKHNRPNLFYPFFINEKGTIGIVPTTEQATEVYPIWNDGYEGCWTWSVQKALDEMPLLVAKMVDGVWKIYRKSYAIQDGEASKKQLKSLWTDNDFFTERGQKALNELFQSKEKIFQSPKSVDLIVQLLRTCTSENDIILDFFSGSATTAHALMQLNAKDGGNRRFVLVQLPEVTDEKSEAFKAGYKNICEIGKERIRRAGKKILDDGITKTIKKKYKTETSVSLDTEGMEEHTTLEEYEIETQTTHVTSEEIDVGFRVFKLDSSNLKIWDDSPLVGEDAATLFEQRMLDYLDVLVPGRTAVEVVYEIMLKLGQDLCEPIAAIDLGSGKTVYGVGADIKFIVCLAPGVTTEDANAMADYAPGRIIFAEQCFENTEQKSNVRLTLKDKGIAIKTL